MSNILIGRSNGSKPQDCAIAFHIGHIKNCRSRFAFLPGFLRSRLTFIPLDIPVRIIIPILLNLFARQRNVVTIVRLEDQSRFLFYRNLRVFQNPFYGWTDAALICFKRWVRIIPRVIVCLILFLHGNRPKLLYRIRFYRFPFIVLQINGKVRAFCRIYFGAPDSAKAGNKQHNHCYD